MSKYINSLQRYGLGDDGLVFDWKSGKWVPDPDAAPPSPIVTDAPASSGTGVVTSLLDWMTGGATSGTTTPVKTPVKTTAPSTYVPTKTAVPPTAGKSWLTSLSTTDKIAVGVVGLSLYLLVSKRKKGRR